jgi:biopolymer transport protein ExbB/TolQ
MTPLLSTDQSATGTTLRWFVLLKRSAKTGAVTLLLCLRAWWRLKVFGVVWFFYVVTVLLLIMAVCSAAIVVERLIKYRYLRNQSRRFVRQFGIALRHFDLAHAIEIAERHDKSPSARVAKAGLASFQSNMPLLGDAELIETSEGAMRRIANAVHLELMRGLTLLASISSTAPLVGVFGTLAGILNSFPGGSGPPSWWLAIIAGRLSVALLPTALSLLVAVPTQLCCKYLLNESEAFDLEMENHSAKVVNYLVVCLEQRSNFPSPAWSQA